MSRSERRARFSVEILRPDSSRCARPRRTIIRCKARPSADSRGPIGLHLRSSRLCDPPRAPPAIGGTSRTIPLSDQYAQPVPPTSSAAANRRTVDRRLHSMSSVLALQPVRSVGGQVSRGRHAPSTFTASGPTSATYLARASRAVAALRARGGRRRPCGNAGPGRSYAASARRARDRESVR